MDPVDVGLTAVGLRVLAVVLGHRAVLQRAREVAGGLPLVGQVVPLVRRRVALVGPRVPLPRTTIALDAANDAVQPRLGRVVPAQPFALAVVALIAPLPAAGV